MDKRQIVFTHLPGLAHDFTKHTCIDDLKGMTAVKVNLRQSLDLGRIMPRGHALANDQKCAPCDLIRCRWEAAHSEEIQGKEACTV